VHGANLGIWADTYLAIGGWQPLVTGEDTDLARRARSHWLSIKHTGAIPVVTSVRRVGRAPRGFSSYLRALSAPWTASVPQAAWTLPTCTNLGTDPRFQ
jgi:hypothetical protein